MPYTYESKQLKSLLYIVVTLFENPIEVIALHSLFRVQPVQDSIYITDPFMHPHQRPHRFGTSCAPSDAAQDRYSGSR